MLRCRAPPILICQTDICSEENHMSHGYCKLVRGHLKSKAFVPYILDSGRWHTLSKSTPPASTINLTISIFQMERSREICKRERGCSSFPSWAGRWWGPYFSPC